MLHSKKLGYFLITLITSLIQIPGLAATNLTRSKRLAIFTSEWAQSATISQSTGQLVVDPNSFTFMCPGQSFLVGFDTKYDTVRHFRFACAFYENASGTLVSKTAANCSTTNWDNQFYGNGSSSCAANQFVAGFNLSYDSTKRDSQYKAVCCPVDSPDSTSISSASCGPTQTLSSAFNTTRVGLALCAGDSAVQFVSSSFQTQGTTSDRVISYKCCNLSTQ